MIEGGISYHYYKHYYLKYTTIMSTFMVEVLYIITITIATTRWGLFMKIYINIRY